MRYGGCYRHSPADHYHMISDKEFIWSVTPGHLNTKDVWPVAYFMRTMYILDIMQPNEIA